MPRRARPRVAIGAVVVAAVAVAIAVAQAQSPSAPRSIAAAVARLVGSRVVVVEPDRRAVAAYAITSGARLWRTELGSTASAHELADLSPGRVLVHGENELLVIEVAAGAIASRQRNQRSAAGAFLWRHAGACALRASCELSLLDCADARPFGDPLRGRIVSRMRFDRSGWDSGCWGFSPDLVGRGGDVVVIAGGDASDRTAVIGVDARSGRRVWTRSLAARSFAGGASPDGAACWVVDDTSVLHAFDCATGRRRFALRDTEAARWSTGPPEGLFVWQRQRVAFVEPERGRRRWQRTIARGEVALVAGARLERDEGVHDGDRERTLLILGARDGAVLARLTLRAGDRVVASETEGALRTATHAIDESGRVRDARHVPTFEVERGPAGSPAAVYVSRPTRREVLRLPSDAWSLGEHTEGATSFLALFIHRADGPGEVRVLSAPR